MIYDDGSKASKKVNLNFSFHFVFFRGKTELIFFRAKFPLSNSNARSLTWKNGILFDNVSFHFMFSIR